MDPRQLIENLRWSAFGRIGLTWFLTFDQWHKENKQVKADIKSALKENEELDNFTKEYIKQAEEIEIKNLPF